MSLNSPSRPKKSIFFCHYCEPENSDSDLSFRFMSGQTRPLWDFEDIGDYSNSFKYYNIGNKIRRSGLSYSISDDIDLFKNIKKSFTKKLLKKKVERNGEKKNYIFIVGMLRSGTTLVEQILASHSKVFGAGELPDFIDLVEKFNLGKLKLINSVAEKQDVLNQLVIDASSVYVKLCFAILFLIVVIILLIITQKALYSPWGRMMRAIRDNEEAANDGLFTPGSYRPMRYTFLIWVMVIVGGSGNNFGAILGGFAVWFLWIEAAPIALFLINLFTSGLADTNAFKLHLIDSVPYFRFLMMGIGLLLIMRYRPKGIIPEKINIK